MNRDNPAGSGGAVGPDGCAGYNRGDIATREEFADLERYFGYERSWSDRKKADHFTRLLVRSRLPEPHDTDSYRRALFSIWADRGAYVLYYLLNNSGSLDEVKKELKKRFGGLEKRFNEYYRHHLGHVTDVCRGTAIKELDKIMDGTWTQHNMDKKERRWSDVSTNRSVAQSYAKDAEFRDGISVILEIDRESIKDMLVSPGYAADQIDQPEHDIYMPDFLFRFTFLEEHRIRPDADLAGAKMKITLQGKKSKCELYKKRHKNINPNWTMV